MAEIMQNSNIVPDILRTSDYKTYRSNKIEYTLVHKAYRGYRYYEGNSFFFGLTCYSYYHGEEADMIDPAFNPDRKIIKYATRQVLTDEVLLSILLKEMPDSLRSRAETFTLDLYLRNDGVILTLTIKPKFENGAGLCYSKEALQHIANNLSQYKEQLAWCNTDIALEASDMRFYIKTAGNDIEKILRSEQSDAPEDSVSLYDCHLNQLYFYKTWLEPFNKKELTEYEFTRDSVSAKAKEIAEQSVNERVLWNKLMEVIPSQTKTILDYITLETLVKNDGTIVFAAISPSQLYYDNDKINKNYWCYTYGPSPTSFISLDCFPRQLSLQEFIAWMNKNRIFTSWKDKQDIDVKYVYIKKNIHPENIMYP